MRTEGQQEDDVVVNREEPLRSEFELVELADAIRGAEELADEKLAQLQKRKELLDEEIAAIVQRRSIVTSDTNALRRELDRVARELARRYGDEQAGAGSEAPQS